MTYTRENHPENLGLDYEHDWAYEDTPLSQEVIDEIAQIKIILAGDTSSGVLEDCSYLSVDPEYCGDLSIGQRRLYELLLSLQLASVYTVTTIGKLAEAMDLKTPMACGKRLENLQSLGAIAGFKL